MNSLTSAQTRPRTQMLNPLQGLWQFWFKDLGSVSFMGTGILGLLLAVVMGFNLDDDKSLQVFSLLLNAAPISIASAIAWQGVRLQATEWVALVPHYREHIFIQMALVGLSCLGLSLACIYLLDAWQMLGSLGLVVAVSTVFIALCLQRPSAFNLSMLLYLGSTVAVDLAAHIPAPVLVAINLAAMTYLYLTLRLVCWHPEAKSVYLSSAETGWLWLPSFAQGKAIQAIQKFFMPINFFIGPLFLMPLVLIPMLFLGLSLFGEQDNTHSGFFLFIYLNSMLCLLLHWSRIMRWRGMQTLYLLPIFHGRQGFAKLMYRSQLRLLLLICVTFSLVSLIASLAEGDLEHWLIASLVNLGVCALSLGLGSACRTLRQLGVVFMGVALGGTLVALTLNTFAAFWGATSGTIPHTFIVSVMFSFIGLYLLSWGCTKFTRVKIN